RKTTDSSLRSLHTTGISNAELIPKTIPPSHGLYGRRPIIMRIVCAVDGSEHSQWGIQALEALAGREPEHVVLLHIVDRPTLQAAKNKNSVAVKRALAAMEKAGTIVLRDAARL